MFAIAKCDPTVGWPKEWWDSILKAWTPDWSQRFTRLSDAIAVARTIPEGDWQIVEVGEQ